MPMKLTYDPQHNVAYLRLHEHPVHVETLHLSDELNIDFAPDGTIYGIELLNANEQLRREHAAKLIVENEATGAISEVQLS